MQTDLLIALEVIRDKALKHVVHVDIQRAACRVADGTPEPLIQQPWTESELALIASACEHMKGIA